MPWISKLKSRWRSKTGDPSRRSPTRALILSQPEHQLRRPYWEYAAQLLMDAARSGKREAIEDAYWQLARALKADRMLA